MKRLISFLLRFVPRKYLQLFSNHGLKLVALFYKGNKVECPICKSTYREFLPYGRLQSRTNALCPNCLSLERHRLIWIYLEQKTDFFKKPQRMLHIAPEVCFMSRFEKIHGENYITGDIESPLAKVKMDIHQIPFEDNSFDVVFCNHVLEHVEDDRKAVREIKRVLKPGGWAILQIPFFHPIPEKTFEDLTIKDPKKREELFGQDDHVRMFGKDYPARLAESGMKVLEDGLVFEMPTELVKRYALASDEVIYRVVKP